MKINLIAFVLSVLSSLGISSYACRDSGGTPPSGQKACTFNARTTPDPDDRSFVAISKPAGGRLYVFSTYYVELG